MDYLFQSLSRTKVVFIVGNHDYLKINSYYWNFPWSPNVYSLLGSELEYVDFPELGTCVYGLSYEKREITANLYDEAFPEGRRPIEILLAHGGDEKHIPINRNKLMDLGYDYIALGHIHRPGELLKNRICYAGSLEPTDKNDTGPHGYIMGTIEKGQTKVRFVPFAKREYIHMTVDVDKNMAALEIKDRVVSLIQQRGTKNIYKITLSGFRDPELRLDTEAMDRYGNILEVVDHTTAAYNYERIQRQNEDNLLGKYIACLKDSPEGSIRRQALFEGVRALLETKRG